MAMVADRDYVEAARAASARMEARLRRTFRDAYGPAEGDRMVDAMVRQARAAILSDGEGARAARASA